MSEPDPKDDGPAPKTGRLPMGWLRGAGLALVAVAVALRLAVGPAGALALVAWGVGLLGLALAAFGGAQPVSSDPLRFPVREPDPPRASLLVRVGPPALGAVTLLYGLLSVTFSALERERASTAWWFVVIGGAALVAQAIWRAARGPLPIALRVETPNGTLARGAIVLGVLVALGAQIAIPASYYQGTDRFDERFAWRMFSAVRVYQCDLGAFDLNETRATPVDLGRTIHVAWVNTMERGREGVIQRYLTWRCETAEVAGARITNQCTTPEGQRVPDLIREIDCATGQLRSVEVE